MRNCERCHEPISSARLVALPNAALCIDCALHMERMTAVFATIRHWEDWSWSRFGEAKDGQVKVQPAERNAQERAERTPYRIAEGLEEHGD